MSLISVVYGIVLWPIPLPQVTTETRIESQSFSVVVLGCGVLCSVTQTEQVFLSLSGTIPLPVQI